MVSKRYQMVMGYLARTLDRLGEVDWKKELGQMDGLECMDRFYEVLDTITKECVPTRLRRTKNRPLWMNRNIMRMLRRKRRLWRAYTREGVYREDFRDFRACLLYTSPSPRDGLLSRMPSSA